MAGGDYVSVQYIKNNETIKLGTIIDCQFITIDIV